MVLDDDVADISRSRTMASPPQRVWDVLADFGSVSSWVDNVDHSCVLNGEGETFGTTRRLQIGRNTLVERIVEFDPPTALAYTIEGLPSFLHHVVNRWTVRPTVEGAEVILTSRVEIASNPVARAAAWAVCLGLARQSDSMLNDLARRTENIHG